MLGSNGSPRILVVEDDQALRHLLDLRLSRDGFEVRTAADGQEALEMLDVWAASLVVTDVMMPRMNGLELCHRLRGSDRYELLPILLLTAHVETAAIRDVVAMGGISLVSKPFDAAYLKSTILDMLTVNSTSAMRPT